MERFVTPCGAICKLICLISLLTGCSIPKYVPVESTSRDTITITNTITYKDTIIITGRADTVSITTRDTSSFLRLGDSESEAIVSNGVLNHTLRKAPSKVPLKVPTITINKEAISFRTRQIPYEVIVEKKVTPGWVWWSLGVNIILLILIVARIYIKLKTIN